MKNAAVAGFLAVAGIVTCGFGVLALCGVAWATIYAGVSLVVIAGLLSYGGRHES